MTIPEGPTVQEPGDRITRPELSRSSPIRASRASGADAAQNGSRQQNADANENPKVSDAKVSEAVAHAVKLGYDVITENISQGRAAAQRFRQGEYNVRDVPGDVETVALRLIQLMRELSSTTFDVCEKLLKEVTPSGAPSERTQDRAQEPPPFRPTVQKARPVGQKVANPTTMKLTTRFEGELKAISHSDSLSRPLLPTAPNDIFATPLTSRAEGSNPIGEVKFAADMTVEGLIVNITIPKGQIPGVYSGLVYSKTADMPLGVLSIQVLA